MNYKINLMFPGFLFLPASNAGKGEGPLLFWFRLHFFIMILIVLLVFKSRKVLLLRRGEVISICGRRCLDAGVWINNFFLVVFFRLRGPVLTKVDTLLKINQGTLMMIHQGVYLDQQRGPVCVVVLGGDFLPSYNPVFLLSFFLRTRSIKDHLCFHEI